MVVKAVVFDLDGTIATFNLDYRTLRARVRNLLVSRGMPPSEISLDNSTFEMLGKLEAYLKNTGKNKDTYLRIKEEALAIAQEYEYEAAQKTNLLPNVEETLESLRRMRLKMGLCTINGEKATKHILNRFNIQDYFDAIISRESVTHVKPHREHLEMTLKTLGVTSEDTVFVGDSVLDMRCAFQMKTISVGLPTGVATENQLISAGANFVAGSMVDIPNLINRINKSSTYNRKLLGQNSL